MKTKARTGCFAYGRFIRTQVLKGLVGYDRLPCFYSQYDYHHKLNQQAWGMLAADSMQSCRHA